MLGQDSSRFNSKIVGNSEIDLPPFFEFKKHDSSTRKEPLSRDPSTALFRAGFDGQPVVDWNDHHGKWCSSVVAHLREQTPKLIAADHRVFVISIRATISSPFVE